MKDSRPVITLIDGNNLIHRSFHAFSSHNLSSREGVPTGAVYGVYQALKHMRSTYADSKLVFVMDGGGKNFRHRLFAEYKGTRKPMDEGLAQQLPYIQSMVGYMGIHLIKIKGVEADDIIGTIARKAEKKGYLVTIISSDKDFCQLVNYNIRIYNPNK